MLKPKGTTKTISTKKAERIAGKKTVRMGLLGLVLALPLTLAADAEDEGHTWGDDYDREIGEGSVEDEDREPVDDSREDGGGSDSDSETDSSNDSDSNGSGSESSGSSEETEDERDSDESTDVTTITETDETVDNGTDEHNLDEIPQASASTNILATIIGGLLVGSAAGLALFNRRKSKLV